MLRLVAGRHNDPLGLVHAIQDGAHCCCERPEGKSTKTPCAILEKCDMVFLPLGSAYCPHSLATCDIYEATVAHQFVNLGHFAQEGGAVVFPFLEQYIHLPVVDHLVRHCSV